MSSARWLVISLFVIILAGCQTAPRRVPVMPAPTNSPAASSVQSATSTTDIISQLDAPVLPALNEIEGTGTGSVRFLDSGVLEVGNENAPLALTVFTEYHCQYCYQFQSETFPQLKEEFVDPGQLKIRFVIKPLQKYPNSTAARQGLLCAAQAGRGWEMHTALTGQSDRSPAAILRLSNDLGLDSEAFATCLESESLAAWERIQDTAAEQLGVTLVPTFFLIGEKTVGLPTYPDFRGWINEKVRSIK